MRKLILLLYIICFMQLELVLAQAEFPSQKTLQFCSNKDQELRVENKEPRRGVSELVQEVKEQDDNINFEDLLENNYYLKAKLIIINKITAKSTEAEVNVGQVLDFHNIKISLLKCYKSPDPYDNNHSALLSIMETQPSGESQEIFKGWIFSETRSISGLEHPIYEVLLVSCSGIKTE